MGVLDGCRKIGKTNNPGRRCGELSTLLPVELEVAHLIPTGSMNWLERYLHVSFHHCRTRGEWFRLSDEEIALIHSIPAAESPDDLPPAINSLYARNWSILHPPPVPKVFVSVVGPKTGLAQINVELDAALLDAVKQFAESRGQTLKYVVGRALVRHLAHPPPLTNDPPLPACSPDPAPKKTARKGKGNK